MRPGGADVVTAWASRAGRTARRHRVELLILAATIGFVLLVGLLSFTALTA